jgi:acyl dehydratase
MTAPRSPGEPRAALRRPPTTVGETFTLGVRLTKAEIRAFARQMHDLTPLHHDLAAARAAGYPGLIASGAHAGAIFAGMSGTASLLRHA